MVVAGGGSCQAIDLVTGAQASRFLRGYAVQGEACVIVANSDGTGERKLATHHIGELFLNGPNVLGPAWSPDGEMIVFAFTDYRAGASGAGLMAVRVKDGVEKLIVSGPWQTSLVDPQWPSGLCFTSQQPITDLAH